ncbi:hypothetical protein Tdes44962_MAKER08886, partial [Teratosphaeria destructans]
GEGDRGVGEVVVVVVVGAGVEGEVVVLEEIRVVVALDVGGVVGVGGVDGGFGGVGGGGGPVCFVDFGVGGGGFSSAESGFGFEEEFEQVFGVEVFVVWEEVTGFAAPLVLGEGDLGVAACFVGEEVGEVLGHGGREVDFEGLFFFPHALLFLPGSVGFFDLGDLPVFRACPVFVEGRVEVVEDVFLVVVTMLEGDAVRIAVGVECPDFTTFVAAFCACQRIMNAHLRLQSCIARPRLTALAKAGLWWHVEARAGIIVVDVVHAKRRRVAVHGRSFIRMLTQTRLRMLVSPVVRRFQEG